MQDLSTKLKWDNKMHVCVYMYYVCVNMYACVCIHMYTYAFTKAS